jgi:protein-S-isoprenylcysteine O-methyltransferase Ste14
MATSEAKAVGLAGGLFTTGYRWVAYFGLMTIFASLIWGFRHQADAPWHNYLFNGALYAAFIAPHLAMTRSVWKQKVWGNPRGSPRERQFYILVTIVTWLAVLALHWPVPGVALALPTWLRFGGLVGALWSLLLFFQGATSESLDGLVGVPGNQLRYSHDEVTPLFTDGPYAEVRHPMYRGAILLGICALVMHPNLGQLFWTGLVGGTLIAFIPVEEAQLRAARGGDYDRYCEATPYRLFRGVW